MIRSITPQSSPRSIAPRWIIYAFLFLLIPLGAAAQFGSVAPSQFRYPAEVEAKFGMPVALTGETVRLDVIVSIDKGYFAYSLDPLVDPEAFGPVATTIKIDSNDLLEPIPGEDWTEQEPHEKYDEGFETRIRYHAERVVYSRQFKLLDVAEGDHSVTGKITMQICDDSSCLPPKASSFSATVLVRKNAGDRAPTASSETPIAADLEPQTSPDMPEENIAASSAEESANELAQTAPKTFSPQPNETEKLAEEGLIGLAGLAFIAGLLSLLTPCVFPMIPITISFFTKRAAKTAAERIGLCTIYSGSIVLGFALLGFGLAMAMKVSGLGVEKAGAINQFAANPWLNLMITAVFVFFALSLFGLFEIGLPTSWANKLQQRKGKRTDAVGAFLMAMIFVIVSFTCTAPIVGPLIVLTLGEQSQWIRPLVGLTAYAVGFALPFFVLGLVPGAISSLPKSGGWLNATKIVMGLIEMAAALKFLSNTDLVWEWNIFTREVLLAAWAAIALITTIYLVGMFRTPHDTENEPVGPMRLTFAVLFGTLAMYLAFGLFGGQLHAGLESFLPPRRGAAVTAPHGGSSEGRHLEFIQNDLERAQRLAREQRKPLFIDFTGWTCTNCRLNEIKVFPDPEVRGLMEQYVRVQLYTDDKVHGEKYQQYQNTRFGTFSLPYYVILTPDDEVIATYGGLIRDKNEFVEFLGMGV